MASGRPLGLMAAWLEIAGQYGSKADHHDALKVMQASHEQRVQGRAMLSSLEGCIPWWTWYVKFSLKSLLKRDKKRTRFDKQQMRGLSTGVDVVAQAMLAAANLLLDPYNVSSPEPI
eukprot:2506029-Amphidinium_carterae.4